MSRQHNQKLIAELAGQFGFRFAGMTTKGHLKWRNDSGTLVITVSALDEHRAIKQVRTKFRHAAKVLPGLQKDDDAEYHREQARSAELARRGAANW
jgi:hypothetical protein